ncbi:MAG: hypothetical protein GY830_10125 [Bacteroidetes bacterium]|nr:hypothetical protein [Bacteroidota bacterium]
MFAYKHYLLIYKKEENIDSEIKPIDKTSYSINRFAFKTNDLFKWE